MEITATSLVFALFVGILFYSFRTRLRVFVLAAASLGYVFFLGREAGIAALYMAAFAYVYGLFIAIFAEHGRQKGAAAASWVGIAAVAMLLLFLKEAKLITAAGDRFANLLIPIGFSFYSFQIISYFADIAAGRTRGDRSPLRMIIYLFWFPRFVSGPIWRKDDFNQQMKEVFTARLFDLVRFREAAAYIVTGFLLKMVVADRLAIYVGKIYENIDEYGGFWLLAGSVLYSFQIYCDFAGYSYAAVGLSRVFGIGLPENFRMPYMSENITEFWRRWHMSLSGWLRDYVYIPLGGNRKGYFRKAVNTLVVFLICGIWHGSGLSFLIWGLLHGVYSVIDSLLAGKGCTRIRSGVPGRIITFFAVNFAWIFFRAQDAAQAWKFVSGIFTHSWGWEALVNGWKSFEMSVQDIWVFALMITAVILLDAVAYIKDSSIPGILLLKKRVWRYSLFIILIFIVIIFGQYGPGYDAYMIYMQF